MTPAAAYQSVVTGLRTALHKPTGPGHLRVLDGPADRAERGSVIVGPPVFAWEGMCDPDEPTSMTVTVYLIEQLGERAIEQLLTRLPELLVALAGVHDATITAADPGSYPTSGADLPCYRLTAEMTL
jgi:hypothetical protein